ncbi:MAG: TniQ family protein [Pseudonocardia sp.]
MTGIRPLPRSLSPLPGESLPGYLLRLAHRLDLSPTRVATLTGLANPLLPTIPAGRLHSLPPEHAEAFARATHLSAEEVTALTLISFAERYPPVNPAFSGRQRQNHGIFVKENWVFSRSSRYCPDCLAGDGSPIQDQHGGAWQLIWRLPVVFACPLHRRLLRHFCPGCDQPAHHRAIGQVQLLTQPANADLHPVHCRNVIASTHNDHTRRRVCRTRLDDPSHQGPALPDDSELLRFQSRLLSLLLAGTAETIISVGQLSDPARYFVDLRLICCLIASSWPAARDLLTPAASAAHAIDEHVRNTREQIDTIRRSGRTVREIAFYDKPPLDSAADAHLLALAHQITSTASVDEVRTLLRTLVIPAPANTSHWTRQFLAGDGHCSPGLRTALGLEIRARNVMKELGVRCRPRSPRPQPVRFGVQHIPQHLLPEWHVEHLAHITVVKPQLLGRAAAARLAQICVGGHATEAAELLGIPYYASENALAVVKQKLRGQASDAFDRAIHCIAQRLDTAVTRIDYGKRRDALKTWSFSPDEWETMIAGLPEQPLSGPVRPYIDWGDSKRLLASVWVWVRITHGEHVLAPAIRPSVDRPRPGGPIIRHVHTRWRFISADQPAGHYIALRQRLDAFADTLTATIDNSGTLR